MFHCFSCGVTGDIFTAAHYLDGKPLEGPTFITENVADLALRFGIPMPENFMDMTEDEKEELKTFAAYRSAMQILISGDDKTRSKIVDDKLKSYKWTADTMQLLGVGWVTDYQNYWKRMLALGYSAEFLRQVDLDNRGIFNEHSIIFTIKDEFGNPVGFSARNLDYEEKSKEYDAIVAKEGKDSPQLVGRSAPRKYINSTQLDGDTKPKNRIYQKGTRLYNLCVAKKHTPPLWIFEGYSDTTTAANESMLNTVAVGSVSFRREQLELILATNQKHLIYVLDADSAGAEGTARFMKLLETELGDRPGLKVEVVAMPAGSDDPDAFIRKNGRKAFEALERMDAFDWKVKQDLASGLDKHDVCNHGVSLIVNEPNRILQYKKACQLAKHCGIPESAVWPQVLARVDQDQAKLSAERLSLTNQVVKELTKNPGAVVSILKDAETRLENLEKVGRGYDKKSVDNYASYLFESYEKNNKKMDLITGWPYFDNMLGGIPTGDSFITVPGKMNQGKTSLLANLQVRLLENNENLTVFAHSLDDALGWYIPRLLGVRYGFPSTWFRKYGYYGQHEGHTKLDNRTSMRFSDAILGLTFEDAWRQARTWLNNLIDREELILADASVLPGTMPAFESWVRALRSKYPDRRLVCCGDNFHIYDLPGVEDGERKTRLMSQYIKGLANRYHATIVMTMELPKESLRPGLRPRVGNIKGTSGVAYDSNMNIGVYNDMKDFPADPKLIWYNSKQPSMTLVKSEVCQSVGAASPVLELVFDKVKTGSSFCGSLFYEFDPESGAMAECRESDQLSMQVKANEPDQRSWKQNPPSNFGRSAPDRTV